MKNTVNNIELQYLGYLKTPLLWELKPVLGLKQLKLPKSDIEIFKGSISDKLVLGKRVEQFVLTEFNQIKDLKIVLENVQIQDGKITRGEIDCIIELAEIITHVEIVYKFYLYDPNIGNTELDHWIGPNRNDTLRKKLSKLKDKQLPLIKSEYAKMVLANVNLIAEEIEQRVFFKAQLFTPFDLRVNFDLLNERCLQGFYIGFSAIDVLSSYEFYVPIKFDWLIEPHSDVDWLSFNEFSIKLEPNLIQKKSQLCWIKYPNGLYQKFFVVWWS